MIILTYIYKAGNKAFRYLKKILWVVTFMKFKLNRFSFYSDFQSNGIPICSIHFDAHISIGRKFKMNNGLLNNMIGRQQPCFFIVKKNGELLIKDNVGISATAIVCWERIEIGNNVLIGGGTVIYDTDYHSLDYKERTAIPEIRNNIKTAPIIIKDNAFIGAHSTILKGVVIGENSIIGAGAVVTKNVPANEIWAGNPAKFIRKI